ncbi:3-(cis-5,6-dihydroxycyclohexa-1,3-dien-1-yl)propanoate dehydrogenase [Blastococcus sp. SYSU D00820]
MGDRLRGLVALVTGGASGIGRGVVEAYLAEGASVVVLDLHPERLGDLEDAGAAVVGVQGDVRRFADHKAAVARCVERFGRLDVLVANSGITDAFTPLVDLDEELIESACDEILAVNVKGYLLAAKAALPELLRSRGSMVFTLSNASFYPDGGGPLYTASKHADLGLMRQLAFELAPHVRVNGVAPGGTPTDLRKPRAFGSDATGEPQRAQGGPELEGMIESVTPLRIAARPEDHAAAYVLLASPTEARTITGTVISTDAGLGIRGIRRVRGGDELPVEQRR